MNCHLGLEQFNNVRNWTSLKPELINYLIRLLFELLTGHQIIIFAPYFQYGRTGIYG